MCELAMARVLLLEKYLGMVVAVGHSFPVQFICEATLELTVPKAWMLAVASLMKAMSILLKVSTMAA